jgi:DNA-binding transcriptional MerR regulator
MSEDGARRWSIGELADKAGLTVRTLRHYDQIGLLAASERTGSGHRRYSQADLWRLLRIRGLRRLGLSLVDVGRVLSAPSDDPEALQEVLRTELGRLEARAGELALMIMKVRNLLDRMDGQAADPETLLKSMEVHTMLEGYFTDEQKQRIVAHRESLGPEGDLDLRTEWLEVLKKLDDKLQASTPAGDLEVQALSARWDEIGTSYTGRAPDILDSARRLWEDKAPEVSAHVSGAIGWLEPSRLPAIVAYVEEARAIRTGQGAG